MYQTTLQLLKKGNSLWDKGPPSLHSSPLQRLTISNLLSTPVEAPLELLAYVRTFINSYGAVECWICYKHPFTPAQHTYHYLAETLRQLSASVAASTWASFRDAESAGSSHDLQLHCILPNSVQTRWQLHLVRNVCALTAIVCGVRLENDSQASRMCTVVCLSFPSISQLPVRLYAYQLEGFVIRTFLRSVFYSHFC